MSKYRIYELAKEYDTTSKVIIDILARNSMIAKNHMSSVEEDAKVVIDRTFARKTGASEEQTSKVESPVLNQTIAKQDVLNNKQAFASANKQSPQAIQQQTPAVSQNLQSVQQPEQNQGGQQQRPVGQPQFQGGQQQRPAGQQQFQGGQQQRPVGQPQFQGGQQQRPAGQPQFQGGQQQRPAGQPQFQGGQQQRPAGQQQFQGGQQQRPAGQQQFQGGQQQRPAGQQQFQGGQQQRPAGQPQFQGGQQQRPAGQPQFQGGQQQRPAGQPQFQGGQQQRPAGQPQFQGGQQQRPAGQPQFQGGQQQRPAGQPQFQGGQQQRPAGQQQFQGGQQQRPAGQAQNKGRFRPPQGGGARNQGQGGASANRGSNQHRTNQQRSQINIVPQQPKIEPPKPKVIKLGDSVTVKELAVKLSREVSEVIKKLMMLGIMVTINQEIDLDTATILAGEFGATVEALPPEEDPTEIREIEDDPASLVLRPPVVTVMGHVDHGKTSLLDAIRQTHVTAQEAGGITQHIGAYQVICNGKKIVFLDTPGHEAFTAMRARGAQVTDIAILVVAADDGVMPQTIEAINHAKSAKVPIIVAINKMDRPGANPDRVKQQLAEYELVPEEWGGDTIMAPVSAQTKAGLSELLEMIILVAEMQEIKANPNRPAFGTIIEAQLDKGRGPVATVLVQKGTLHIGDSIIAGTAYGKVRAMINDRGDKVKKAEPSMPVEVLGLADVPQAGDVLVVVDEKTARAVAEKRIAKKRTDDMKDSQKVSLEDLFQQIKDGDIKDLNIVVKADVQGSIEALRQALVVLKNKEVRVNVVHAGVGAINETDVMLASASNALIIGFNVRPDANARKAADAEKIDVRIYRVIYEAINDVEAAMTGMLAPEYKEVVLGRVEVRKLLAVPKAVVAGSYVLEGKITSTSQVRIVRNGIVVHEGKMESLRRFKDDVKEVAAGYECGISIEKFRDIKEGDIIEAFIMELVK